MRCAVCLRSKQETKGKGKKPKSKAKSNPKTIHKKKKQKTAAPTKVTGGANKKPQKMKTADLHPSSSSSSSSTAGDTFAEDDNQDNGNLDGNPNPTTNPTSTENSNTVTWTITGGETGPNANNTTALLSAAAINDMGLLIRDLSEVTFQIHESIVQMSAGLNAHGVILKALQKGIPEKKSKQKTKKGDKK